MLCRLNKRMGLGMLVLGIITLTCNFIVNLGWLIVSTIILAFIWAFVFIYSIRSWFFFAVTLTLVGTIGLYVCENQNANFVVYANQINTVSAYLNTEIIDKYLNPLLECVDPIIEILDVLVMFVESVIWRAAQEFGVTVFEHAAYDPVDISLDPNFPIFRDAMSSNTSVLFTQYEARLLEEWAYAAMLVESDRQSGGASVTMEMRAKRIANTVIRELLNANPGRIDLNQLVSLCGFMREGFAFIIDFLSVSSEFLFILLDIIIDLLGSLITGEFDFTFLFVLVKALIQIILIFIDPKACFRNFPKNFPASAFPCFCTTVYPDITYVPNNILNAFAWCVCATPEGDKDGDIFEDILAHCEGLPFIRVLIGLLQLAIQVVTDILNDIKRIKNTIMRIIDIIERNVRRITNAITRDVRFETKDGGVLFITNEVRGDNMFVRVHRFNTTDIDGRTPDSTDEYFFKSPEWYQTYFAEIDMMSRSIERDDIDMQEINEKIESFTQPDAVAIAFRANLASILSDAMVARQDVSSRMEERVFNDFKEKKNKEKSAVRAALWHQLQLAVARSLDKASDVTRFEFQARDHPASCDKKCMDDFSTIGGFIQDLFTSAAIAIREPTGSMHHRHHLSKMDFSGFRSALRSTAERSRNDGKVTPDRETLCRVELGSSLFISPAQFPDMIKRADPAVAEDVLQWLETRLGKVFQVRDATTVAEARHAIREEIDAFHYGMARIAAEKVNQGRFVPVIAVGITLLSGSGFVIVVGLFGIFSAVLAPLLGFAAVLVALLFFALFGVLMTASSSMVSIFFTGDVMAADPVNPIFFVFEQSIAAIFEGGLNAVDFTSFRTTAVEILYSAIWYVGIELVRNLVPRIPYFVDMPPPTFDPESGLTLDTMITWGGNIFQCNRFRPCTVSGAYGGAPCRCPVSSGSFAQRDATPDNPCPARTGRFNCWPVPKRGVQLQRFGTVDQPTDCRIYGYPDRGYTFGNASIWDNIVNTLTAGWKVLNIITRLVGNGFRLPAIGLLAFIFLYPFCCLKPIASFMSKLTFYLLFIGPIMTLWVAPYLRDVAELQGGKYGTMYLADLFDSKEFGDGEIECAIRYSFAFMATLGWSFLTALVPFAFFIAGGLIWLWQLFLVLIFPLQVIGLLLFYIFVSKEEGSLVEAYKFVEVPA